VYLLTATVKIRTRGTALISASLSVEFSNLTGLAPTTCFQGLS